MGLFLCESNPSLVVSEGKTFDMWQGAMSFTRNSQSDKCQTEWMNPQSMKQSYHFKSTKYGSTVLTNRFGRKLPGSWDIVLAPSWFDVLVIRSKK